MGNPVGVSGRAVRGLLCALSLAVVGSGADAGTCWYGPSGPTRTVPLVTDCSDACFSRLTAQTPWRYFSTASTEVACAPSDHDTDIYSWRQPTSYEPSGIGVDVERTGIAEGSLTTTAGGTSLTDVSASAQRIATKLQNYGTRLGAGDLTAVFDVYQTDIADDVDDLINQIKGFGCLSGIAGLFGGGTSSAQALTGLQPPPQVEEVEPPEGWVELEDRPGVYCEPRVNKPHKPKRNGDCVDLGDVRGQNIFGGLGGFSVVALIPILKDILGVDIDSLAGITKQLCHQRSIEAATKGQARLQGETLKALYAPTTARPVFVPGAESGDARAQYEAFLTDNGVVQTGDAGGLLQQMVALQVSQARVSLQRSEEAWGGEALGEFGSSSVSEFGAWTALKRCGVASEQTTCSSAPTTVYADWYVDRGSTPCGPQAANIFGAGAAVGTVITVACQVAYCSAVRVATYNGDRINPDVVQSRPVVRGLHRNGTPEWGCEGRVRIGSSGGSGVQSEDAPDFYAFDEGADPATVKAYWEGLVPEIDFGEDSILDADDVDPGPRPMASDSYVPGRCSVASATTALDCYVVDGTWTPPVGERPLATGAASCIDQVEAPVGDAAEGISGAMRKLRSYANERLRQSDFGRYACGFAPPAQADVDELCWPRASNGKLVEVGAISIGRFCVMGDDAPGWVSFLWAGLEVLLIALASWAVVRMWF